jgi:hypothetical protein
VDRQIDGVQEAEVLGVQQAGYAVRGEAEGQQLAETGGGVQGARGVRGTAGGEVPLSG